MYDTVKQVAMIFVKCKSVNKYSYVNNVYVHRAAIKVVPSCPEWTPAT